MSVDAELKRCNGVAMTRILWVGDRLPVHLAAPDAPDAIPARLV